jgi:hypothetical protein
MATRWLHGPVTCCCREMGEGARLRSTRAGKGGEQEAGERRPSRALGRRRARGRAREVLAAAAERGEARRRCEEEVEWGARPRVEALGTKASGSGWFPCGRTREK